MDFEEWKKQAIEKIDRVVEEDVGDNQGSPDYDEDDMIYTAMVAVSDVMADNGLDVSNASPLCTAVATELAKGWIDYAYRQWYTGDRPQEENEKTLIEWIFDAETSIS